MSEEKPANNGQSSSSSELALSTIDIEPALADGDELESIPAIDRNVDKEPTSSTNTGDADGNSSHSSESGSSDPSSSILSGKEAKSVNLKVSAIIETE